jgi:hypothetical protein
MIRCQSGPRPLPLGRFLMYALSLTAATTFEFCRLFGT